MNWALLAGYAVAATDTGHSGGTLDAAWAMGHLEKIVDFGWRAVHGTAVAAKAIIADYYQKAPAHPYFSGCSDGGREALMEAERFPKDYDGIVAGAPANNWSRLLSNAVGTVQALNQPDAWIPPEKLAIISKAVHAQCPAESGYVEDPSQCHFDPSSLVCKAGQSNDCLTEAQTSALKKIYTGSPDASGKAIYPGYPAGGEAGPTAWSLWISGSEAQRTSGGLMNGFSTGFFGNFVFNKADWGVDGVNVGDGGAEGDRRSARFRQPRPQRLPGRRRQADPVPRLERLWDFSHQFDTLVRTGRG
jgi:Tannase and feruloyl esterase